MREALEEAREFQPNMNDAWDADFLERSPVFAPLRFHARTVRAARWPSLDDLQRLLGTREPPITTCSGARLSFVPQGRKTSAFEEQYESRTYLKGEVQVRRDNWHDLLNALVWLTFPRSKAALNGRHYDALLDQKAAGIQNRGPVRDAMTLFDEGGVIVAARDPALLRLIESFAWKDLFWHNRARIMTDRKSTRLNSSHIQKSRMPSSA